MTERAYWNGTHIIGKLVLNGVETEVVADRDIVHRHAPGYSDALSWELDRFAQDIFEKLKSYFETSHGANQSDSCST